MRIDWYPEQQAALVWTQGLSVQRADRARSATPPYVEEGPRGF